MAIKHAAWVHGTSVQFENASWAALALRQGFFTTVRPSNEARSAWIHFAIPTPVIVNDVRLKAQSAMLRFSTGTQANIGAVHVYDGEKKILENNAAGYHGQLQFTREVLQNLPLINWGTGISILVNFTGNGSEAWVQLISAGIDFW